ncbi:phospholipase D-like domain-containing protein [Streptomyces hoynatensis]|nr:phospholipase D-like domain-containing protein [Streptomyces hoynatensis]
MRGRRVLPPAALVCCLLAWLLTAGPAQAASRAAEPDPAPGAAQAAAGQTRLTAAGAQVVLDGPVFNDPAAGPASGAATAAQRAVFDQLIGLIDAVPSGERIRLAMFEWVAGASGAPQQVAERLIAAHDRGVDVQLVLNTSAKNQPMRDLLDAALGHDESAASWVVGCGDYASSARGCLARNYSHEKFALFSRVAWADGTSTQNVVWQSSSNLTDWYVFTSYNDAYTLADAAIHQAYQTHFGDLQAGRRSAVDPDYFWATPSGSTYKALFYPRALGTGDPVVNVLRGIECSYQDGGSTHQTDIRLVISSFTGNRQAIADELLRLRGENCWIDVVYAAQGIESDVLSTLRRTASNGKEIQLTPCTHDVAAGHEVRPHAKVMLTDGFYDDDLVPRVYTGSANFTHLENSDDSQLRIMGRQVHDAYLSWFYDLRAACQAGAAA